MVGPANRRAETVVTGSSAVPLTVGIIGTRGIPNAYGGFEEFADHLVRASIWEAERIRFRVYGETPDAAILPWASAIHVPIVKRTHPLRYYVASLRRAMRDCDIVLCCGVGLGIFAVLPRLRGLPLVVNPDGCEWRRSKWPGWIRAAVRASYTPALRAASQVVLDSEALRQDFGRRTARNARYIGYQAPEPRIVPLSEATRDRLRLTRPYVLAIARLEPENNIAMVIEALDRCRDLEVEGIIVGSRTTAHYRAALADAASPRVRFLGGIYDRMTLDELRGGCVAYVHGHSVGGTNPSLLEALARAGGAVLCHDNRYNRETAADAARYFSSAEELASLLRGVITRPTPRMPVRDERFLPDRIAARYLEVFRTVSRAG